VGEFRRMRIDWAKGKEGAEEEETVTILLERAISEKVTEVLSPFEAYGIGRWGITTKKGQDQAPNGMW